MSLLGDQGLPWPWESMHVEALAWFDQWLKGQNTGITHTPVGTASVNTVHASSRLLLPVLARK